MKRRGRHPDVVELEEYNRAACDHPDVADAVPRAEVEAWLAAGGMMSGTRYRMWWCTACGQHVPTYQPKE
jgi:hypothetical protein